MAIFMYRIVDVPNFAFAVKVEQADIQPLESWCERVLGQKLSATNRAAKWFQTRGVFFFNTRRELQTFVSAVNVLNNDQVMINHDSAFFENSIRRIQASLI
jgi:hypothetical protein